MIVITGAAGFIGSCLVSKLNSEGFYDLVLVDDFSFSTKNKNFEKLRYSFKIEREEFHDWLKENHRTTQFIFHIGARTKTTEKNLEVLNHLNIEYSQKIWNICVEFGLPMVYASSAATYGLGENGFDDDTLPEKLIPLNLYGESKNNFDRWALEQENKPYFWAGLKFFNVYGPNEYHKDRMASVIFHTYNQIKNTGEMYLFKSHKAGINDGEQMRDFVYVKDVVDVCLFFLKHRKNSGIYNLGSGKARTFNDLAKSVFDSLSIESNIKFKDTPEDIRNKYQYFTEAKMDKLKSIGYDKEFQSLEDGVKDYVINYLSVNEYY